MSDDGRIEYEEQNIASNDIEIEKISSEEEDYESGPADYKIATYPADYTLEVLHEKWKAGDIEIPKFQRKFVWKQVQASKLIESFLVGLPVPSIFLYTERETQKYLVIDGQQRLKSIFYFFEEQFGEEEKEKIIKFRLKGLSEKSKWSNKLFSDFDEPDRRKLKNAVLRAFIVQQLDPEDDTSIYHIFERLNTGGTLLTNQEVRNCVYGGKLNDMLIDLNTHDNWRKILGKPASDTRQKDIELLLRFLALTDTEAYEKPLKDFLSKYMRRNRTPDSEFLAKMKLLFKKTCDTISSALGEKPFHIKAGLNAAAFDSVMVAFSKHLDSVPADIGTRYGTLKDDDSFKKSISGATTDEESVRKRFARAEEILFGA